MSPSSLSLPQADAAEKLTAGNIPINSSTEYHFTEVHNGKSYSFVVRDGITYQTFADDRNVWDSDSPCYLGAPAMSGTV